MSTPIDDTPHSRALLAAEQLEAAGESVTVDAVRRRAGVGMSTATAAARHWKQLAAQKHAAEEPPAPAFVQNRFAVLGEAIWREALEAARREVADERRAVEGERVRFAQEADDLNTALETARAEVERLGTEVRHLEEGKLVAEKELEASHADSETLSDRLLQRDDELLELHTKVARAEGAAEASRLAYQELLTATPRSEQSTDASEVAPGRSAGKGARESAPATKDS